MAFAVASVLVALSAIYTLAHIIRAYLQTGSISWSLFLVLLVLTFIAFILRSIAFKHWLSY